MSFLNFTSPYFYLFGLKINVLAQAFGLIALVFMVVAYLKKQKTHFLVFCIFSFFFTMLECIMLNAITGFIKPLTGIIRNLVCLFYLKQSRPIPKIYNIVFVLLMVIPSVIFVQSFIDTLPIITSIISTLVTIQGGVVALKGGGFLVQIIMIVYNFLIGAYIGVIRQSIVLVSIIVGFVMMFKDKGRKQTKS